MCEMVSRERQERVAQVEVIARMIATVFNADAGKMFGGMVADYASEVFQETYDPDVLKRKVAQRRRAQAEIAQKRRHDQAMLQRLDRMGEFYDQNNPNKVK